MKKQNFGREEKIKKKRKYEFKRENMGLKRKEEILGIAKILVLKKRQY